MRMFVNSFGTVRYLFYDYYHQNFLYYSFFCMCEILFFPFPSKHIDKFIHVM